MHGHDTAKPNLTRISCASLQRPRRIAKKIFRPIAIEGLFSLNQTKLWNGSFQACPGLTLWPLLGRIAAIDASLNQRQLLGENRDYSNDRD